MVSDTKREKIWDPDLMILRARSLKRLVEELKRNGTESRRSDGLLFKGKFLAVPVLLSLATEIALKAWQCRERNGPPDHGHDLLKLFDGLGKNAQRRLADKMPEVPSELPGLPPYYPGLRRALCLNKDIFVEWRYSHEHLNLYAETGVLKTALTAIVEAYNEPA